MIGHICFARNPFDWGHGRGHPADVETLVGSGAYLGLRFMRSPKSQTRTPQAPHVKSHHMPTCSP